MKKKNLREALIVSLAVGHVLAPMMNTHAQTNNKRDSLQEELRASYTTESKFENEMMLPAREEPEEHKINRLAFEEQLKVEAESLAKKKTDKLIKEKQSEWEENFPVVEGNTTTSNFLNELGRDAVSIAREYDLYPSVMLAQAVLESRSGLSGLTVNHHNLFGIKGKYEGKSAHLTTWEDVGGKKKTIKAGFKSYPSYKESMEDYAHLLKNGLKYNPSFYNGTWRSQTSSYKDVTQFLQGRYATDTQYANKLNQMIARYDLTRFDNVEAFNPSNFNVKPVINNPKLTEETYLVKPGDTVQLILKKTNMSLEDFLNLNGLSEARIHENQIVKISKIDKEKLSHRKERQSLFSSRFKEDNIKKGVN